jgi:hypothetical protein
MTFEQRMQKRLQYCVETLEDLKTMTNLDSRGLQLHAVAHIIKIMREEIEEEKDKENPQVSTIRRKPSY